MSLTLAPPRGIDLQVSKHRRLVTSTVMRTWLSWGYRERLEKYDGELVEAGEYVRRLGMLGATCCAWAPHVVEGPAGQGMVLAEGTEGGWVRLWWVTCGEYSVKARMRDGVAMVSLIGNVAERGSGARSSMVVACTALVLCTCKC